ncbi:MAG: glycoside hydrolase family 127 protein [Bacteroidales bacterium]|nr:glycoside hydrolase family 127 protein [Bacteroidales bacterium]
MKKYFLIVILPLLICACSEKRQEDAGRMEFVSFSDIRVDKDDFWTPYFLIHKDITLPLAVSWTESHFDSPMVPKAIEGIAYSLQFEKDTELAVKRSTWVTRLKNEAGQRQFVADTCEVSSAVTKVFNDADLLRISGDGNYADNLEQTLYNEVLPAISLKGDRFFSKSPLSSSGNFSRLTWEETQGSAMDLFRIIPYLGNIVYGTSKEALWVNLYMSGNAKVKFAGEDIIVHQTTTYPWDGYVALQLELPKPLKAEIRLRIPSWCEDFTLSVNGRSDESVKVDAGYAVLSRKWQDGDNIELVLDMPVKTVDATYFGKKEEGKRAVRRGPIVYCIEEKDNPFGFDTLYLSKNMEFGLERLPKAEWCGHSLMRITAKTPDAGVLTFIPYFAWGNRDPGKMEVLVPYQGN